MHLSPFIQVLLASQQPLSIDPSIDRTRKSIPSTYYVSYIGRELETRMPVTSRFSPYPLPTQSLASMEIEVQLGLTSQTHYSNFISVAFWLQWKAKVMVPSPYGRLLDHMLTRGCYLLMKFVLFCLSFLHIWSSMDRCIQLRWFQQCAMININK